MKIWQSPLQYLPALILLTTGALVIGYGIGANLLAPSSSTIPTMTATTTTTTTKTSYSTVSTTVTETRTQTSTITVVVTTSVVSRPGLSQIVSNSTIVTSGRTPVNRTLLLFTMSIDKPSYRLGETMQIRGTVTNLSPKRIDLFLTEFQIYVYNSTGGEAWTSPIGIYDGLGGLRPPFEKEYTLNPQETVEIPYVTADWNFTGVHIVKVCYQGNCGVAAEYNGILVPEGKYTIAWQPGFSTFYNEPGGGCCEAMPNGPITLSFEVKK